MMKSLICLDYRRLGKQRLEAKQLIKSIVLEDPSKLNQLRPGAAQLLTEDTTQLEAMLTMVGLGAGKGWRNHPARTQWEDHLGALAIYHDTSIVAWKARGYNNEMPYLSAPGKWKLPPWWGDDKFHGSHRSNLLRKAPEWYGQFGWTDDPEAEYFWPSRDPHYANLQLFARSTDNVSSRNQ